MCGPAAVPLVIAAIGAVTAGVGAYSAKKSADAQIDAAAEQQKAQQEEMIAKRDQNAGLRVKELRAERARMRVAAGEAGVSGQSFEAQLAQSFGQQNQDLATANKQGFFDSRALNAQYKSTIAGIDRPTYLSSGLQIGSGAVSGYSTGLGIKAQLT